MGVGASRERAHALELGAAARGPERELAESHCWRGCSRFNYPQKHAAIEVCACGALAVGRANTFPARR